MTAPVGGAKPGSGGNVITVSPRALQTALAKGTVPSTGRLLTKLQHVRLMFILLLIVKF